MVLATHRSINTSWIRPNLPVLKPPASLTYTRPSRCRATPRTLPRNGIRQLTAPGSGHTFLHILWIGVWKG
jgi:hypothetical protein